MASEIGQNVQMTSREEEVKGEIAASVFQIAILNNMLPRGYRFEAYENARKNDFFQPKAGKRKKVVISNGTNYRQQSGAKL